MIDMLLGRLVVVIRLLLLIFVKVVLLFLNNVYFVMF